jgi:hypothetical protein
MDHNMDIGSPADVATSLASKAICLSARKVVENSLCLEAWTTLFVLARNFQFKHLFSGCMTQCSLMSKRIFRKHDTDKAG